MMITPEMGEAARRMGRRLAVTVNGGGALRPDVVTMIEQRCIDHLVMCAELLGWSDETAEAAKKLIARSFADHACCIEVQPVGNA